MDRMPIPGVESAWTSCQWVAHIMRCRVHVKRLLPLPCSRPCCPRCVWPWKHCTPNKYLFNDAVVHVRPMLTYPAPPAPGASGHGGAALDLTTYPTTQLYICPNA